MATIHELRAKASENITRAKAARDRLKESKPSVLNATTKLAEAMDVMDALIDAVEAMSQQSTFGGQL